LQVLDAIFDPQDYAIAPRQGSKLRLPIDLALLDAVQSEWWRETVFSNLGPS
jgi:polar amino acid transport system substrate-binding protein